MAKSMARLGLTSFLDGFAMGGLFTRARWFGAPILGFAPSPSAPLRLDVSADAELDRQIAELRAFLDRMEEEDEAKASLAKSQLKALQDCAGEKATSRAKRLQIFVSVLETYLRENESSDVSLKSAPQSSRS